MGITIVGRHFILKLLLHSLLVIIAALATSIQAAQPQQISEFLDLTRIQVAYSEGAAACSLKNHYPTAESFFSGIQAGDRFASYLNPNDCIGSPDYPFSVYFISLPLFHFTGVKWPVGVEVQIWSVANADSCAGPDEKLFARHCLLDSASFSAPHVGVISLPDPVCVNGPFYIVIEYDGTTPGPYPSVLFDSVAVPVPCVNWGFRDSWAEWTEFWTGPIAGNFMVWVDGYSNSDYCGTIEDPIRTTPDLHDAFGWLRGNRVSVVGYYTDSVDGKLLFSYSEYLKNSVLQPGSEALIVGPQPHDSFANSLVLATGYLQANNDPHMIGSADSVEIKLYVPLWEKVLEAPDIPYVSTDSSYTSPGPGPCVPKKHAVLIGGGPNETNNHRRYWNELVMAYNGLAVEQDYCAQNVTVHYFDGQSEDASLIPQSSLRAYTKGGVDSTFTALASKAANSIRLGQGAIEVYVYVCGQGSTSGLISLGGVTISGQELRTWIQRSLDSVAGSLNVEITASCGGIIADSLLALDDHSQAKLHVMSAAGDVASWSGPYASRLHQIYLDSFDTGTFHIARAEAVSSYVQFVDSTRLALESWIASTRAWLLAHPVGSVPAIVRTKVVNDTVGATSSVNTLASQLADPEARPNLWLRSHHTQYGRWQDFAIPENGQAVCTFKGDPARSGSVTVYKDTSVSGDATAVKKGVWSWNIPGSAGYAIGNSTRVINGESTRPAIIRMHDDDAACTYTARLRTDQPYPQSSSNAYTFPGFSLAGIVDGNSFLDPTPAATNLISNVELPGVILNDVSGVWGACGSTQVTAQYNVPVLLPWHSGMEVRVVVKQVSNSGTVQVDITGATNTTGNLIINSPGTYKFNCGAFTSTGAQNVTFTMLSGCFTVDAFSIRSTAFDPPSCCVGTTGNVNGTGIVDLGDLSMMVAYLTVPFPAKPTLPCVDEANVNTTGIVDLADLSTLVAYLTTPGIVLPNCP